MMTLIECAKALQEVFNENLELQEVIDALERQEILEMEQILMQEEILKEAYDSMDEEDKKTYTATCHHAWEDFYELCDEVEAECDIDLRRYYRMED